MRYELAQETRERDTPKVEMDHSIWVYDKKSLITKFGNWDMNMIIER